MEQNELLEYIQQREKLQDEANKTHAHLMLGGAPRSYEDSILANACLCFMEAVYDKALRAREKYGFAALGWAYPDWREELQRGLAEHVQKGDPRDVAVYALFAWFHGWSTATPPAPEAPTAAAEAGELSTRNVTYLSAEDVAHVTTGRRYISMSEGVVLVGTNYFRELQLAAEQAANATKVAEDAFQEAARLQQELAEARGYADHLQHAHAQRERHLAREAYTRGFAGSAQGYNAEIGPDCEKWPAWKGQREVDVEDILSHPEEWMPAPTPPATPEAKEAGGEEGGGHV